MKTAGKDKITLRETLSDYVECCKSKGRFVVVEGMLTRRCNKVVDMLWKSLEKLIWVVGFDV